MHHLKNSVPYEEVLDEQLKDPEAATAYLNACLEPEPGETREETERHFLMALRDVARAHGFAATADKADLGRKSLYKALSANGNPQLTTVGAVLAALGLRLIVAKRPAASKDPRRRKGRGGATKGRKAA